MASSGSFNTSGYSGRYLVFSWSTTNRDITNNRTTISWTLKGAGGSTTSWYQAGNFRVTIDGQQVYYSSTRIKLYNGTTVASGSFTLNHDSAGNRSFGAYAEAGIYTVAVNCSGSGSWTLDTIPRQANITSAPNFNDTQNPTIQYSNPAGTAVTTLQACISLTGASADIAYRDIPKTGSSYTFNLTEAERNVLRQATTGKTRTVRFYVMTVIGGTTFRNYVEKTLTITDANPTFSVAYLDSNSTTSAITGNNQQIVRNKSTLRINVTNAEAKKYATLTTATCTVLGSNYSVSVSSGSGTLNIGTLDTSQDLTIAVTVTDSRGYTTTQNITVTVLDWVLPTAIITMQRHNNFYSETDINVDGSYSSVNDKNTLTIQMRYKKVDDCSYSSYTTLQDNVTSTFTWDNNYAWNIQVLLTDKFGSSTYNLTLSRGMPIIFFDRLKSSTGFNCFPTGELSVEVDGIPVNRNIMTRSLSAQITSLTVNTYTIIPLNLSNSVGSRLTTTNDGGIKIGAGVSKILVSGQMSIEGVTTGGNRHLRIVKNSYSANNTLGWVWDTLEVSDAETLTIIPQVASVSENDVIYLYYYVPNSADKIGGNAQGGRTSLTVEVIG